MKDEISIQIARAAVIHKQIVSSLNIELPTARTSGDRVIKNILPSILITPALFMTERNIKHTTQKIASSINSSQYQLLVESSALLFQEVKNLAAVCGFSISELNLLSSSEKDVWRSYDLKKLAENYLRLRVILENFLLEIYGPLNDLYSFYRIPVPIVQNIFMQDIHELKLGDELTFVELVGHGRKIEGYPDLNKFKQLEGQEYTLAMQLSIASQTIVADEYLQEIVEDYTKSSVRILVNQVLEEMYSYAFEFIYQQIYTNRYTWEQIKTNTIQKYQTVFVKSLINKVKDLTVDVTLHELLEEEDPLLSELIKELESGLTQTTDLFDLETARVYRVELRNRNAFELKYLKSFFSADIYLYEAIVGFKDVLVDCYSLGYSPLTYKIIEDLLN